MNHLIFVKVNRGSIFHEERALTAVADGSYQVRLELSLHALSDLHAARGVESWTAPTWDTINYYLLNRQGIGLGHLLFGVPKDVHRGLFGELEPDATLLSLEGAMATISLRPATPSSEAARRPARTPEH